MDKILFVIGLAKNGGAEKRAILISKLLKSKYDTKIFAFSGEKSNDIDYIFRSTYSDYKRENIRKRVEALTKYIGEVKPTFVFSFVPHVNYFVTAALKAKRFSHIKHIVAMVNSSFDFKSKMLLVYSLKRADCVYYQTNGQQKLFPPKCKSFILPNPIIGQKKKHSNSKYKFLAVGRLEEQKDYTFMLKSFSRISQSLPTATLDIFGSGNEKRKLNEFIYELKLENKVFIHEYTGDIENEYLTHDIFLFTSKKEGFPNALAEAMSHSLICFTTHFETGCSDLIIPNKTGYLCTKRNIDCYSSLVVESLEDYNGALQIGINGCKHVNELCDVDRFISEISRNLEGLKYGTKN